MSVDRQHFFSPARDILEHAISGQVPVLVVGFLEAIEIHNDHRQRPILRRAGTRPHGRDVRTAISHSDSPVSSSVRRDILDVFEAQSIVDHHADFRADVLQNPAMVQGEGIRPAADTAPVRPPLARGIPTARQSRTAAELLCVGSFK